MNDAHTKILNDVERVPRRLSSGVPLMKPKYNTSSKTIIPTKQKITTTSMSPKKSSTLATTSAPSVSTTEVSGILVPTSVLSTRHKARGKGRSKAIVKGRGKR